VADSDDWRVTILISYAQAGQAQQSLSLRQVEEDIRRQAGRGIVVGAGEAQIFLYAGTETAAGDAERITRDVLAGYGMAAESALHRWHPIEERRETPDVPMPQTKAERPAVRERAVRYLCMLDADTRENIPLIRWAVSKNAPTERLGDDAFLLSKLQHFASRIRQLSLNPPT